jgi:hypothetical protein
MEHDDYLYVFPVINYKEITSFSYGHNKPNDVDYRARVIISLISGDSHGRDRMIVEFTTTFEISAYHH